MPSSKSGPRKRSRRLEEMLPSLKRARRAPAKPKKAEAAAVVAAEPEPAAAAPLPKAFSLAETSVDRVEEADPRFRLRHPDPPVEIFKHIGYTHRGASRRTLASGSLRPTRHGGSEARAGTSKVSSSPKNQMSVVFDEAAGWIEKHCKIPTDFERPARFGPLSGLTYAERVVQSYAMGLLKADEEDSYPDAL